MRTERGRYQGTVPIRWE